MGISVLENIRRWLSPDDSADVTLVPFESDLQSRAPLAFVIDDEDGICKLITMTLATMGINAVKFHTAKDAIAALDSHLPGLIFLDVALKGSDAVDVIRGLGERGYGGIVQLMSGSNVQLLEDVRRVGARHGLHMRPPLTKPFGAQSIRHVITESRLAKGSLAVVDLDEALANDWLELWYQPKIDLRSKSLAGAEGLIRCRHPVHGVLERAPSSRRAVTLLIEGASTSDFCAHGSHRLADLLHYLGETLCGKCARGLARWAGSR